MECPNCSHENSAEAQFCSQCGTSLTITCPVCSTVSAVDAKFCSNCGTALQPDAEVASSDDDLARYLPDELQAKMRSARAGHAMQGERRTVTMLFADIKGSTAAAEQLDPEDWAVIVNGAFEHLIAPVYHYEGTLAHLQGDAVLAFFGAPIAHEDDPVRALQAGLEIIEAMSEYSDEVQGSWGIPIEVRVGINTGLVVVGEVGSDLRVEYTALGDAINVAARMEQTASPGTVRVTDVTLSLTGGAFEAENLGPVEVKGKSEPVLAHRVIQFVGGAAEEEDRPIVGRGDELELLDDLRSRLLEGTGWIASVIAEAGVGKSRLLQELRQRSEANATVAFRFDQPGDMSWMFGVSRSYDASNPFSNIRDLLRRWWGIDQVDADLSMIETAVTQAQLDDPDAATYLAYLAGVPLSQDAEDFIGALETPVLHAKASETLSSYLTAISRQTPALIVLEDLHWADDLSLALVDDIMELAEGIAIGLVVAMRPYREESTWHIHEVAERDHHHRYHYIDLAPLQISESTELLISLLDNPEISPETRQRILKRSDGNPLFIEEMVRSMNSGELDDVDVEAVPTSLTGMLTARLDRLDEESKYVVQMASVLGSEFDRDVLGALLGGATAELEVTDLLRRGVFIESSRRPGSLGFRHALIQEAAYETILRRTRKDLHHRVADHLMEAHPDAVQDIARHLVEADALLSAFPYLIQAGRDAMRSMALADAIRLLTTALENTPDDTDPELIEEAHDSLGQAYALVPDLSRAAYAYQRLYDFGEEAARPSTRVAALNRLAFATASLGADLEGARSYLDDARSLAEETGDDVGLAEYHMNACYVESLAGEIGKAVVHDEATVALGTRSGVDPIRLAGMTRRAINYAHLLDWENGIPSVEAALEAGEEEGLEEGVAIVDSFASTVFLLGKGDIRGALETAEQAQKTLSRYSSFYGAQAERYIAALLFQLGDIEDALGRYVESRRIAEMDSQGFVSGAAAAGMALIYATAGMEQPVREFRAETTEMFPKPLGGFLASSAWADLGFSNLHLENPEEAEADFSSGLAASSITQFIERPRLLGGRALTLALQGNLDQAEADLAEAFDFAREKSFVPFDAFLGYVAGVVLIRRERFAEAGQSLVTAQQTAMDRGERLTTVQILLARARVALQTGRLDEAAGHAEAARDSVSAIAETMADDALKESFMAKWHTSVDQISTEQST